MVGWKVVYVEPRFKPGDTVWFTPRWETITRRAMILEARREYYTYTLVEVGLPITERVSATECEVEALTALDLLAEIK